MNKKGTKMLPSQQPFYTRTSEFYEAKRRGEKVTAYFEYDEPRSYVVEHDGGLYVIVMATSARDAYKKAMQNKQVGIIETAYAGKNKRKVEGRVKKGKPTKPKALNKKAQAELKERIQQMKGTF